VRDPRLEALAVLRRCPGAGASGQAPDHRHARLAADGIDVEVIDLRSLRPLDFPTIAASVRRTRRLAVVHEGVKTMGIGAEIAALVAESDVFAALAAPIVRLGGADVPIPYNPKLEKAAVPQEDDIVAAVRRLVREGSR
jgi:pyruvate dehydrogenase E1 component beta subunit